MKSVFGGRHRKSDFFPIYNIKRQWGTGGESGVLGRRSPILSKSSKKKRSKNRQNWKKSEKSDFFFFTENGLKCIRNTTKHLYK